MSARRRAAQVESSTVEATPAPTTPTTPTTPTKVKPLSAKGLPCLCGCGEATKTDAARFLPGHDAKLRAVVVKAHLSADAIPEATRPFFIDAFTRNESIAGLILKSADAKWLRDTKAAIAIKVAGDEVTEQAA